MPSTVGIVASGVIERVGDAVLHSSPFAPGLMAPGAFARFRPSRPPGSSGVAAQGPDPVVSLLASGVSATASTATASWTAVAAGTLLTLHITGDDYASANPSGWSLAQNQNSGFHGSVFWYKFSNGTETTVTYVIGSAVRSAYAVLAHTNIDNAAGLVISNKSNVDGGGGTTASTPSVTPVTGMPARVHAIGQVGFSNSGGLFTTIASWTNSYVEKAESLTVATPGEAVGVAVLDFNATGSNSTSTAAQSDGAPQAFSGIIGVFKVA